MNNKVYFIAGIYGVGKSTICQQLSTQSKIPFYSAGDLISEINGETYGANKAVKDMKGNQDILVCAVNQKLKETKSIILAGHFCIFDKDLQVKFLPEDVFGQLAISKIILLEASSKQIKSNLQKRDGKRYTLKSIEEIKNNEHKQAYKIAKALDVPLYVYEMQFDDKDVQALLTFLTKGE